MKVCIEVFFIIWNLKNYGKGSEGIFIEKKNMMIIYKSKVDISENYEISL